MGCPDAGVIATYVENLLDDAARAELSAHADSCAACRRAISQLARFAALGSLGGDPTLSAARRNAGQFRDAQLHERVFQKLNRQDAIGAKREDARSFGG